MQQKTIRTYIATALSAGMLCWAGCDSTSNEEAAPNVVNAPAGPGGPGGAPPPGGGVPGGPGPGGGRSSPIRNLMMKINDRNPNALTKSIARGLESNQPDWPTLEKQAGEFVQVTNDLAKYDPPRGSKESWDKLTKTFQESASELDQAVRAKKRDDAVAASTELSNSCMQCHREHRRMPGGGFGRPGGGPPGGRFGPPGGGPPPGGGGPSGGGPPPAAGPPPGGPPGR
jgi:hypothetical protein